MSDRVVTTLPNTVRIDSNLPESIALPMGNDDGVFGFLFIGGTRHPIVIIDFSLELLLQLHSLNQSYNSHFFE